MTQALCRSCKELGAAHPADLHLSSLHRCGMLLKAAMASSTMVVRKPANVNGSTEGKPFFSTVKVAVLSFYQIIFFSRHFR